MRSSVYLRIFGAAALTMLCGQMLAAQDAQKDAQAQTKGLPPRASAADYQAQTKVGAFTLAAEFTAHGVAVPDGIYTNEDYVTVEVALYGLADKPLKLAQSEFSLRVNGKPVAAEPVGRTMSSLKDPEWEPPSNTSKAGKTSVGSNGGGQDDPPPAPPKMPFELKRAMQQRVTKAELPEGERTLPVAGLLFFAFRGKAENIRSVELSYDGAAGKVVLPLHP
jgi:hypothetical protein